MFGVSNATRRRAPHSPVVAGGTAVRRVLLSYTSTNRFKPARLGNTWLARSGSRPLARSPSQSNGNESCEKKTIFNARVSVGFCCNYPVWRYVCPRRFCISKSKEAVRNFLCRPTAAARDRVWEIMCNRLVASKPIKWQPDVRVTVRPVCVKE